MNEKGNRYTRTGGVNFAAACMAVGVPLWQARPVTVTLTEGRPDHGSWNLHVSTIDGEDSIQRLSEWWSKPHLAPAQHPFSSVMAFIREKPRGTGSTGEWMDHAHQWLARRNARPLNSPKRWQDVPDFVARSSNSVAGYVFAVVHNRQTCLDLYNRAVPEIEMRSGKRMTRVGTNLPKRMAGELISRMKG